MIFGKVTKYGAGLTIYGDFSDFVSLHQTVSDLTNGPTIDGGLEDFMLGLAYEIRHAYQGDRELLRPPANSLETESSIYFGFKQLWPIFLMQLGLLRWSAGFQPTNKEQQANLFRIEACAERVLVSYDPFVGRRCVEWLSLFPWLSGGYLLQFVEQCSLQYVSGKERGKARFKKLPDILHMLSPLSQEYRAFEEHLEQCAKDNNCRVQDLHDPHPWPDFKW
ncbi:MAG TPA: hypothetical protein VN643_27640 [Pyrinomonadaceae bacterium]|nr:hypothetical protein [Pyrinomonadaceae bacterium]